ncbi:HNH endonuclease, partial [Bacillus cereus]
WKSIHRAELINSDNLEILSIYNSEIRGLYNYYKLAKNVHSLQKFRYIMKFSMVKTFASKYKLSVSKIMKKFNHEGNFRISYTTKTGQKHRYFYNEPLKRVYENPTTNREIDIVPNTMIYAGRNSLIKRLKASKCEWCQTENTAIEMHHVKKLKELKGKQLWEKIMIARNRKTLALCKKCHVDLHAGR